jgi:hypothetical protein
MMDATKGSMDSMDIESSLSSIFLVFLDVSMDFFHFQTTHRLHFENIFSPLVEKLFPFEWHTFVQ